MARRDKDFSNKVSRVDELKNIASDVGKNPNPIWRAKKRSGILILGLLVVAVIGVGALIFCNSLNSCQVNVYAELNGQRLEDGKRYTVSSGDVVNVEAAGSEAKLAFITYYFVTEASRSEKIKVYDNRAEIEIPQGEPGDLINLLIEPVAANDDGTPNTVTKTGWQKYTLEYIK